jgi:uroporphyrin-III C-methyltransferase
MRKILPQAPAMAGSVPEFVPGSVWLVGAGPGDPGLLTVLAMQALSAADVVLYDSLVNTDVLAFMGPHGRACSVGRRKGKVTLTEAQTIALMIRHATAGRRVVRLKGGDPFIFGRGGEEAEALAKAGIPFRIVPGVTAGIGGLAYAGIVATRRGINNSVVFLTGHDEAGRLPEGLDWPGLAREDQTLVVYMGLTVLDEIASALLAHGRDHRTPLAIVSAATTAAQQTLVTTLGESVLAVRRARIPSPALIVVGRAADPANIFAWFDPATAAISVEDAARAIDAAGS